MQDTDSQRTIISGNVLQPASAPRKRGLAFILILLVIGLLFAAGLFVFTLNNIGSLREIALGMKTLPQSPVLTVSPGNAQTYISKVEKEKAALDKKLDAYIPKQPYMIINTSGNRFRLAKYKDTIREGMCSTGSYTLLKGGDKQEWIFATPRGMYKIKGKTTSPVWIKPDWAFIEEGMPVPAKDDPSRYEYGVLGDYALSLGSGYMIHGTIWKRFLGMPVTHGCVRLGDADLDVVYANLEIGSKVYIF